MLLFVLFSAQRQLPCLFRFPLFPGKDSAFQLSLLLLQFQRLLCFGSNT